MICILDEDGTLCKVTNTCVQLLVSCDWEKQRNCDLSWKMNKNVWAVIKYFITQGLTATNIKKDLKSTLKWYLLYWFWWQRSGQMDSNIVELHFWLWTFSRPCPHLTWTFEYEEAVSITGTAFVNGQPETKLNEHLSGVFGHV